MIILFISTQAQTYYGKNLFGRLQIINDSTCTVTFISWLASHSVDTCYIYKHGDTIFLSTKAKWRYKVNAFEKRQIATNPWFPIIIKKYKYSNKKYEYISDAIGVYDSVAKSIVLEDDIFSRGNYIIVFEDLFIYYRVKCSFDNKSYYVVLKEHPDYTKGVIFDDFPLLIKKNRLIPIDKEKQVQCWLDNGFFFPKMKMSKKHKKYNIINGNYIGLRNLPTKMESLEKLKPLPRKYIKYLDNAR